MRRHVAAYGIGAIVAIALGSWMGCNNGAGPGTLPEPREVAPPASHGVDAPSPAVARVIETAAQVPPLLPWHDCLNDVGGVWQVDDGRRCVATQSVHVVTGRSRHCRHNRGHFPDLDWRCCVDDGSGQCVPGSERSFTPHSGGPGEEPDPEGHRVWIDFTVPESGTPLCEGDSVTEVGVRRSESAGALTGSVLMTDPTLAAIAENAGLFYIPQGSPFRFEDGETTTRVTNLGRVFSCPNCPEVRDVLIGILGVVDEDDETNDHPDAHEIGPELAFPARKETDVACQQQ